MGDKLIIGTQGNLFAPGGGPGGKLLAFNKYTGALIWATQLDDHYAAIVTQFSDSTTIRSTIDAIRATTGDRRERARAPVSRAA